MFNPILLVHVARMLSKASRGEPLFVSRQRKPERGTAAPVPEPAVAPPRPPRSRPVPQPFRPRPPMPDEPLAGIHCPTCDAPLDARRVVGDEPWPMTSAVPAGWDYWFACAGCLGIVHCMWGLADRAFRRPEMEASGALSTRMREQLAAARERGDVDELIHAISSDPLRTRHLAVPEVFAELRPFVGHEIVLQHEALLAESLFPWIRESRPATREIPIDSPTRALLAPPAPFRGRWRVIDAVPVPKGRHLTLVAPRGQGLLVELPAQAELELSLAANGGREDRGSGLQLANEPDPEPPDRGDKLVLAAFELFDGPEIFEPSSS